MVWEVLRASDLGIEARVPSGRISSTFGELLPCQIAQLAVKLYLYIFHLYFPFPFDPPWIPETMDPRIYVGEGSMEDQGGEHKISQSKLWEKEQFKLNERFYV